MAGKHTRNRAPACRCRGCEWHNRRHAARKAFAEQQMVTRIVTLMTLMDQALRPVPEGPR
jgi:hypothetical protein